MTIDRERTTLIACGLLVWITPAVVAGALGWQSLWGGHSAFADYLLPLPLSGGLLHVPSFAIFVAAYLFWRKKPSRLSWLPVVALAIGLASLAAMVDYELLNAWLFTDYQPVGSPLQWLRSPQRLFVTTDCLWLALLTFRRWPKPKWLPAVVPASPILVIVVSLLAYPFAGPVFEAGSPGASEVRGDQRYLVFTNQDYDADLFEQWVQQGGIPAPWTTPNSEHVAIFFTRSRQQMKTSDFAALDSGKIIATLCWYEEDRTLSSHDGLFDCFDARMNLAERVAQALRAQAVELPADVRQWRARAALCANVSLEIAPGEAIAGVDHCRQLRRSYPQDLLAMKRNHGRSARVVRGVERTAAQLGFSP